MRPCRSRWVVGWVVGWVGACMRAATLGLRFVCGCWHATGRGANAPALGQACLSCTPVPHAPAFRPNTQIPALEQELLLSLLPKDENDARGVVVEVRWRAERLHLGAFARPRVNCPLLGLAFLA